MTEIMLVIILVILMLGVIVRFLRNSARLLHRKLSAYKRPIWNALRIRGRMCSATEIDLDLRRIVSLPQLSRYELELVLAEMVKDGILVFRLEEIVTKGDPQHRKVFTFGINLDAPPPPPENDGDDGTDRHQTPGFT